MNQYGVTAEDNDRLLELMGGCRHDWIDRPLTDLRSGPYCAKCGVLAFGFYGGGVEAITATQVRPLAAVGRGNDVTLGEMHRLCWRLWPGCTVEVGHNQYATGALQYRASIVPQGEDLEEGDYECGTTPEAALCAAILAARAKE